MAGLRLRRNGLAIFLIGDVATENLRALSNFFKNILASGRTECGPEGNRRQSLRQCPPHTCAQPYHVGTPP
jgi:hypothetical protein